MIGVITPVNTMASTDTLTFTGAGLRQVPEHFESGPTDILEFESSADPGFWVPGSITSTNNAKYSEEIEVKLG